MNFTLFFLANTEHWGGWVDWSAIFVERPDVQLVVYIWMGSSRWPLNCLICKSMDSVNRPLDLSQCPVHSIVTLGFCRTMNRRAEEERTRQQEERRRQEIMMRQQEMQRRSGGGHMDSGMPPRSREEMMVCNWYIFVHQYSLSYRLTSIICPDITVLVDWV